MKVLKFGGTSVGSAERMRGVADIVVNDEPKIVVLSAMSGTTNSLVAIGEKLYADDKDGAKKAIAELEYKYFETVKELYKSDEYQEKANAIINEHFDFMKSFVVNVFNLFQERALLAQGELLSTKMFHLFLEENGVESALLPALDFMRINRDEEPDMEYIRDHAAIEIKKRPGIKLFITQGYICRNSYGEIDNLKRGGSDYTASIVGNAVNASEIQNKGQVEIENLKDHKNQLEIEKNNLEDKYQSLVIELENAQKKIKNLENDRKNDRQKQNEFNQKIDELNQETDYLIEEIDKWQM